MLVLSCSASFEAFSQSRFMIPKSQRSTSFSTISTSFIGSWLPGVVFCPSRSVDPDASTTWMMASACMMSSRNWFPSPRPLDAPETSPATSISFTGMSLMPFAQTEFFGLSTTPISSWTHLVLR